MAAPVDAIEVHYVLAGTMHLMTKGATPIVCGAGSLVVIPPGLGQSMAADGTPKLDVFAAEHCSMARDGMLLVDAADGGAGDLRVICGLIMANLSGSFGLLDNLTVPIAEHLGDSDLFRSAYGAMLEEIDRPGFGSRALSGALMKVCLLRLLRQHIGRQGQSINLFAGAAAGRLSMAVTAVLDRPAADHTVASLASVAAMSRSTFAREFSAAFRMSPMEFVAKTRLHHAAEILRSTNLPVKMVAGSIGFASRSHFSRAFKATYGKDPSKYRKLAGQAQIDVSRPPC